MGYLNGGERYKKDDEHSSMGRGGKIGVQRCSRWTFWRSGMGEPQKIYCDICKKRCYKAHIAIVKDVKICICDKCNKRDIVETYIIEVKNENNWNYKRSF